MIAAYRHDDHRICTRQTAEVIDALFESVCRFHLGLQTRTFCRFPSSQEQETFAYEQRRALAERMEKTASLLDVQPARVDILQTVLGINFDLAPTRAVGAINGALPVPSISCDDPITNKLASGRPQDLADVDHLRRAAFAKLKQTEDVTKL